MSARLDARGLIGLVLDDGTFTGWDTPVDTSGVDPAYAEQLARAHARSGVDEAVVTGAGSIRGYEVAVIVGEFGFLGGSIGVATAARLVAAVERATAQRLPLLAAPASGGTRMQEGTLAFVADDRHLGGGRRAQGRRPALPGLPAAPDHRRGASPRGARSGHVTVAEPGALIGFLGPRVFEALYGERVPVRACRPRRTSSTRAPRRGRGARGSGRGGQPGAAAARAPTADAAVAAGAGPGAAGADGGGGRPVGSILPIPAAGPAGGPRGCSPRRPDDVVTLSGTGEGERDAGLLLGLARFGPVPCVLLGQDRRGQTLGARSGPAALREARRGMRLAEELRLPLLTVIDTPGADAVGGGRGGRPGRRDRPLPGGPGHARRAGGQRAARAGHRRRRARAAAGRPGGRRPSTPGWRRCRRRVRARSSTGTSSTRRCWPGQRTSAFDLVDAGIVQPSSPRSPQRTRTPGRSSAGS